VWRIWVCDFAELGNRSAVASGSRETIPVHGDGRLLDAVLDAATSLIVVADPVGSLVRWNKACERLVGYRAADFEAEGGLFDLVPREERPIVVAAFEALKAGESPVRTEFHWRTRDGELRLIEWSNTALIDADGAVTHVVGTGIDVTETREWVAERTAVEERLRHIADHDALTGLYNRRRFEQELDRHIIHGRRYGMDGALLVIDLDHFKQVNDGHGHRAGDRVLAELASVLRERLRESDILARFGGDEFAVLMPHGGAPEAAELANLVVNAVRGDVATPAGALDASVGWALFEAATTSSDEVLSRADDAMYADKANGGRSKRHLRSVE
jgi:diguanylate cyclase (GGDEF)-like protein/PAS domain S-box-containing protein